MTLRLTARIRATVSEWYNLCVCHEGLERYGDKYCSMPATAVGELVKSYALEEDEEPILEALHVAFAERLPPSMLAALRAEIAKTANHEKAHEEYGASFTKSSWIVEAAINLPTTEQLLFTLAAPAANSSNNLHPQRAWMSDKVRETVCGYCRWARRDRLDSR
jgi:hypothetical protein